MEGAGRGGKHFYVQQTSELTAVAKHLSSVRVGLVLGLGQLESFPKHGTRCLKVNGREYVGIHKQKIKNGFFLSLN